MIDAPDGKHPGYMETEYLNVWVSGAIMMTVPIKTDGQKEAIDAIMRGSTAAYLAKDVVAAIEAEPRLVIKV